MSQTRKNNKQIEYSKLYDAGFSLRVIADYYGVDPSSVSRSLARARQITCPFTPDCKKCPFDECAFKPEYAKLINRAEKLIRRDKLPDGMTIEEFLNGKKSELIQPQSTPPQTLREHDIVLDPPKKRRGRPPKVRIDNPQTPSPITLPKEATNETVQEVPKKRRGMPRKNSIQDIQDGGQPENVKEVPKAVEKVEAAPPTTRPSVPIWKPVVPEIKPSKKEEGPPPTIIKLPTTTREKKVFTPPPPKPVSPKDPNRIEPKELLVPFKHRELPMTDGEIRQHFRLAKDQYEDIKILAELNGCDKSIIRGILGGVDPPKPKKRQNGRVPGNR